MNLPNMHGVPSIQSMENIAALGMPFPQVGGYAPQAGSMPWDSLSYHNGYESNTFPMHNHDNAFMMKPNFTSYSDHTLPDGPKSIPMSEPHGLTSMEPPAIRPTGNSVSLKESSINISTS